MQSFGTQIFQFLKVVLHCIPYDCQEILVKKVSQYLIYPFYVFSSIALFFIMAPQMKNVDEQKGLLLGITTLYFIAMCIHERISPYRKDWVDSDHGKMSDALYTLLLTPLICEMVYQSMKFGFFGVLKNLWPHQQHPVVQLVLLLVVSEFGHYWYHRQSHRKKGLWKLHLLHHKVERIYSMNSARFHGLDMALNSIAYLIPSVLFGVSPEVYLSFILLNSITGTLEHANIHFEAGFLNYFFNTAQLHRFHHSELSHESQKNFGKVLCIWDLFYGTHYLPKTAQVKKVGARRAIPTLIQMMPKSIAKSA